MSECAWGWSEYLLFTQLIELEDDLLFSQWITDFMSPARDCPPQTSMCVVNQKQSIVFSKIR